MAEKKDGLKIRERVEYYKNEIWQTSSNFIKWNFLAIITGGMIGAISSGFGHVLEKVTSYRKEYPWFLFLLPLLGVVIVFLYQKFGKEDGGTNQVFSTVRARDEVPASAAPLIFISTALTHMAGGSPASELPPSLAAG